MIVTFCGHSYIINPEAVEVWLTEVVMELIKEGATQFYLGGYGSFDQLALKVVRKLKKEYPHIETTYVMAYLDRLPMNIKDYDGTTYPPIEEGPIRFAISRRNKWMAEEADVLVAYVQHEINSGAATMWKQAKRCGKPIIRYGEKSSLYPNEGEHHQRYAD